MRWRLLYHWWSFVGKRADRIGERADRIARIARVKEWRAFKRLIGWPLRPRR